MLGFCVRLIIAVIDATLWPSRSLSFLSGEGVLRCLTWLILTLFDVLRRFFKDNLIVSCRGQLLVDEAVSLAKSICSASPNAICFALLPQFHASSDREVIVKHRRQFEDLLMARLD